MKNKLFTYLTLIPVISAMAIFFVSPAVQAEPLTCNMQTFSNEDDVAHQMSLPFNLFLGGEDYNQVYLTTNATMTFGSPDANYWSYPSTPSVSLAGWDWVTWGEGAYVSYGYNSNSFCIEWSVRSYPQRYGDLTQIRLMVNRFNNGNWHGEITTFGWLPENLRRGVVSEQNGGPLIIEAAFDVIRGVPVEVEPAPAPTSFDTPPQVNCWDGSQADSMDLCPVEPPNITCWDNSVISWSETCPVQPSPVPTQTVEPTPTTTPSEQPVEPTPLPSQEPSTPSPSPTPSVYPSESQSQLPVPVVVPSPSQKQPSSSPSQEVLAPTESPVPDPSPSSIDLPSNNISTFVILDNGVVLDAEVASALELFDSPELLLATIFYNPEKAFTAFMNVGADMTPQQRHQSQQITISVIIYAQLMNGLSAANMLMRRI